MEQNVKSSKDYAAQAINLASQQKRDPDHVDRSNVTEALRRCLEYQRLPGSEACVCGYVSHFQTQKSDRGWGCGFRNIQMIASYLLNRDQESAEALFAGCGYVPDLLSLQGWLECAWKAGIDTAGGDLLGNIAQGSEQWIGTTECAALLRFFGFKAEVVDFTGGLKYPNVTTDRNGNDVHMGVECNHCHQYPIVGPRFNSQVVDDFDLCMNCHTLPESRHLAPFRIIERLRAPDEKGGSIQDLQAKPTNTGGSIKELFADHMNKGGAVEGPHAASHDKAGFVKEDVRLAHEKAGTLEEETMLRLKAGTVRGSSAASRDKAGILKGPPESSHNKAGTTQDSQASSHDKAGTAKDPQETAHDKAGTTKEPVLADKAQHGVTPHEQLMHWCWDYFSEGSGLARSSITTPDTAAGGPEAGPSTQGPSQPRPARAAKVLPQQRSAQAPFSVFRSGKSPLYFQHHGHSRTIIGMERLQKAGQSKHEYNLLVLDPSIQSREIEARLKSGKGWQKLLKLGVGGLAKAQYQLLYVRPGLIKSEDKADWNIMTAVETF